MPKSYSLISFADHLTAVLDIKELRSISKALFSIGLTPGWPLSEQPGFSTAGFRFGNFNLELCAVDRQYNTLNDWLTFEPTNLEELSDELSGRDIQHDPFDAVVIKGNPIYTRVDLPSLAQDDTALQLCHTFYPTRTTGPIAPENKAGIKLVSTIEIGMNDASAKALQSLLAPKLIADCIEFEQGPSLKISKSSQIVIHGMTVVANDPVHAAKVLLETGMQPINETTVRVGSVEIQFSAE